MVTCRPAALPWAPRVRSPKRSALPHVRTPRLQTGNAPSTLTCPALQTAEAGGGRCPTAPTLLSLKFAIKSNLDGQVRVGRRRGFPASLRCPHWVAGLPGARGPTGESRPTPSRIHRRRKPSHDPARAFRAAVDLGLVAVQQRPLWSRGLV